jgi:antitoxin component HigA of HigAB toxin-antitoxin module
MEKIFCNATRITTDEEYDLLKSHINNLIDEATTNGCLSEQGADNEFTHEIARLGKIGALYETEVLHLPKRAINPLVLEIEKEIKTRGLSQRKAAELIGVNEPTFLNIMRGKRYISMRMAKKLFNEFKINPELIIKYS